MSEPINLVIPNTTEKKMEAIVAAARAMEQLCKAIASANVRVDISHNQFTEGSGVKVKLDEK